MPSETGYLALIMYDATIDASSLFLDFRSDVAGTSNSNMVKIDTFANGTSASIVALQANKPTYVATGSYISSNYYEASISGFSAYTTNQLISLKVDTTSDGSVTLNINSLGTKSLQKIDSSGNLVNLSGTDLKKNRDYFFRYNGSSWVLIGSSLLDQISISGSLNEILISSGSTIQTSGSTLASLAPASGSYVVLDFNSTLINGKKLVSGSAIDLTVDASASTVSINGIFSGSTQTSSGSSTTTIVHPSGLAHSIYGQASCFIPLNTTYALTGGETNYTRIPDKINGFSLITAAASCSGSSTSGSPVFTIKNGSVSMLTTNITIDEGEYDSSTSGCPAVIDTSHNTISTGDKIWAACSVAGTGVTYAGVGMVFNF
jgi:hypothetical protein